MDYPYEGERQELRQERREERRQERREDGEEYVEDDYDDGYYYGDYDEEEEAGVYGTLPCTPNVVALEGELYYVCDSAWYIRTFSDDELVYVQVPDPIGN